MSLHIGKYQIPLSAIAKSAFARQIGSKIKATREAKIIETTVKRKRTFSPDPYKSVWGTKDLNLKIIGSRAEKLFRRRFRISYDLYQDLLKEIRDSRQFEKHDTGSDVVGEKAIPLELKVFGALRILARSSTLDEINELSAISKQTVHSFFERFVAALVSSLGRRRC